MTPYRPQYAYPTPKGFRDEQFHYSFDGFNTPLLNQNVAANSTIANIPLVLQTDAPFLMRGIKVSPQVKSQLLIQFKDPWGNYLSTGLLPIALYASPPGGSYVGYPPLIFEPEIKCPIGGVWWVWLQNGTNGALAAPEISFYGVKRYRDQ